MKSKSIIHPKKSRNAVNGGKCRCGFKMMCLSRAMAMAMIIHDHDHEQKISNSI